MRYQADSSSVYGENSELYYDTYPRATPYSTDMNKLHYILVEESIIKLSIPIQRTAGVKKINQRL